MLLWPTLFLRFTFFRLKGRGSSAWVLFFVCVAAPILAPAKTAPSYQDALDAVARRDSQTALAVFKELIQKDPQDWRLFAGRAGVYLLTGEYQNALSDSDQVLSLKPEMPENYGYRAEIEIRLDRFDQAERDFSEAIKRAPKNAEWYWKRGGVYQELKKFDLALIDLNEALRLQPNRVEYLLARAYVYRLREAYVEALDDLDEALLISASREDLYMERADIFVQRGEYSKAILDFEQGLRLATEKQPAYNAIAWLLAVAPDPGIRDGRGAIENGLKSLALSGAATKSASLDTVAAAFAENGQYSDAVNYQLQAIAKETPDLEQELKERLALYQAKKAYRDPLPDLKKISWDDRRYACFNMVWSTVDQEYFDASLGGVDWRAVREKYRIPLTEVKDDQQLRGLLQMMLNELHRTHFAIIPRSTAVFSPEERNRQGTVGARLEFVDHQVVVAQVLAKSSADQAGLRAGDAILSLDGITLESLAQSLAHSGLSDSRIGLYLKDSMEARFGGKVGSVLKVVVEEVDGTQRTLALKCVAFEGIWSDPVGNFPSVPIDIETHRRDGIAYVRFNTFALPIVKPVKTFFRSLQPGDGLIVDLRGNPGGALIMAPGLTGWLSQNEFSMGVMHLRDNDLPLDVYPQSRAFTGPIAVLIDGSSASTSEVFADGLREERRARIFGETSAGAALPSAYKRLPNDDLFQYAVGDIRTRSGRLLEGEGVQPDEKIAVSRNAFAASHDPVIDAAQAWLLTQRKNSTAPRALKPKG